VDLKNNYLSSQLIAYIGNKRRLLAFLSDVFSELSNRNPKSGVISFGDLFAGSGSVSRLAKSMGFSTATNDWEFYSRVINTAHLCLSPSGVDELFQMDGGLAEKIAELNNLRVPDEPDQYISRFYAPAGTESADYRHERLFYTRENALFIDAVRNRIEEWYSGWELSNDDYLRKCILLAPLLYQAATHANTNGVFKAYHKGFGGHGGDALSRILADMKLQLPELAENLPGRLYKVDSLDAADFVAGKSFDICYLDPPYNQHQYGSNYFMLNTIALWDKPAVPMETKPDGSLRVKAGIRADWVKTKSAFCYAKSAPLELRRLIENIDSRFIVLSYNTEGIIPFAELCDILSDYGKIEIFCRDYIIYRGGKQSLGRSNRNVEFQLVLTRGEPSGLHADRVAIDMLLRIKSIISIMNESYVPARIKETFVCSENRARLTIGELDLQVAMEHFYRFTETPESDLLSRLSQDEVDDLLSRLEYCRCRDKQEEAEVLMMLISDYEGELSGGNYTAQYRKLWAALLKAVRKFAFRKYVNVFEDMFSRLQLLAENEQLIGRPGNWKSVKAKIVELRRIADLRLQG
jgi:adenine-specific DNA-methyltransferase